MVNIIRNPALKYTAEDMTCKPKLVAVKGWELVRDSRGIPIGRFEHIYDDRKPEFCPF